jgi:dinuclear metal center YbgI/SA1388 family protein
MQSQYSTGGALVRCGAMARAADIVGFLDELLEIERFADYGPNGLQVPGGETVETILTGVSAHRELFERAIAQPAQLVLAHHGILWEAQPRRITPPQAARLKLLLTHGIGLAAYHLPLDAHRELGNNALLAQGLGAEAHAPAFAARGNEIGVIARFPDPGVPAQDLFARVAALTQREPLVFAGGPPAIRTLGIVSGGGASSVHEAIAAGLDAFLTGEPAEWAMADAREGAIHFIAAGHYATETFGIRRVGELVAERFGVAHVFAEIPNPV